MTEPNPADREGMFINPVLVSTSRSSPARVSRRLAASRGPVPGDAMSVVTCTWCGSLVADTEAHRQMHSYLWQQARGVSMGVLKLAAAGQIDVARASEIVETAMNQFGLEGKDRVTSTEHDAALFEQRRGQSDDADDRPTRLEAERDEADE